MDVITELEQQRDSLKQNIHEMNENIKKLTGRDPAESRRLSATKRIQLKRNSFGMAGENLPHKRANTEKRRWGNTAMTRANNLDSGGEEQEEKKPAIQSSVVVTGKPIEPLRPLSEDTQTKKRNKRMFGLLMGTLKQFKRESQVKTEQEARREEKLMKVDEQVQKDKDDAVIERRELFQTRRGKQQELRNIEFKIEMAQLNEELKTHYEQINDFIQLKSTPRIFYKPAEHNEKTSKLLKDSQTAFKESLQHRMREISMCTEEDMLLQPNTRSHLRSQIKTVTTGKTANDPIIIDQAPSQRDLFAEDADIDQQEQGEVFADDSTVTEPSVPETMEDIVEPVTVIVEEVDNVESVESLAIEKASESTGVEVEEHSEVDRVDGGGDVVGGADLNQDVDTPVIEDPLVVDNSNNVSIDDIALPSESITVSPKSSIVPRSPKTEDEELHDEFAAKLLEEPVSDDRRVVLSSGGHHSFSVVDERIVEASDVKSVGNEEGGDDKNKSIVPLVDPVVSAEEEAPQGIIS